MFEDIIILVALLILLMALVWLIVKIISAVHLQRRWVKGWGDFALLHGLKFTGGFTRCSVTGMYSGRILHLLGTLRTGTALHLTTNNYTSNTLIIKTRQSHATRQPAGNQKKLSQTFSLVSGSKEFYDQLLNSRTLGKGIAPLASIQNLTISLSGEELSLTTPRLYVQSDELLVFLEALSELAGCIEELRFTGKGSREHNFTPAAW